MRALDRAGCLRLLFTAAFVAGAAASAFAADDKAYELDCKLGFDKLKETIGALSGAEKSEKNDFEMVQAKSAPSKDGTWWIALFVLTKSHHYAHPTVTRKLVWKEADGRVITNRTACGYGEKAPFDKVMAEFADLDRRMNEAIEKQHPPEQPKP